jgi:hypothetical protein
MSVGSATANWLAMSCRIIAVCQGGDQTRIMYRSSYKTRLIYERLRQEEQQVQMIQYLICYIIFLVKQVIYIVGLHKSLLVHWFSLAFRHIKDNKVFLSDFKIYNYD